MYNPGTFRHYLLHKTKLLTTIHPVSVTLMSTPTHYPVVAHAVSQSRPRGCVKVYSSGRCSEHLHVDYVDYYSPTETVILASIFQIVKRLFVEKLMQFHHFTI